MHRVHARVLLIAVIVLFVLSSRLLVESTSTLNNEHHSSDDHLKALQGHVHRTYPLQSLRFEQLQSLLASLRTISSLEVQRIFFKNILGYCSIELILRNLYETITVSS
jgi:cell division septal protein FtsQ